MPEAVLASVLVVPQPIHTINIELTANKEKAEIFFPFLNVNANPNTNKRSFELLLPNTNTNIPLNCNFHSAAN